MERSKRVVFISHCILNQNAVVHPLARAKGAYKDIIKELMDNEIGIHQLPCPEYRHLGLKREPMTKEDYDTYDFRIINKNIAMDAVGIIIEYLKNGYEVLGIIGINESPTCSIKGQMGILMEELLSLLESNHININLIDVPTDYFDGVNGKSFIEKLHNIITN
jgi:predicted secreted protein